MRKPYLVQQPYLPTPHLAFAQRSKASVTLGLPQAGHISLDSTRESRKFGPRVRVGGRNAISIHFRFSPN
jgi:hypothetical protein